MALNKKITKELFDALPAEIQKEYKLDGDKYVLDVEDEDVGALSRAHIRVKAERAQLATQLETARAEHDALVATLGENATETLRKAKDVVGLEKLWKEQKDAAVKVERDGRTKAEKLLADYVVENTMAEVAGRLALPKKVGLLKLALKDRFAVDVTGDRPTIKVLDKEGKETGMSVADLEKEFRDNDDFADIILASQGSGSGAPGGNKGGGAPQTKKLSEMSGPERLKFKAENPAEFARAEEAASKARTVI